VRDAELTIRDVVVLLEVLDNAEVAGRNRKGLIRGGRALSKGVVGSRRKRIFQILYEAGLDLEGAEVVEQRSITRRKIFDEIEKIFANAAALLICGGEFIITQLTAYHYADRTMSSKGRVWSLHIHRGGGG
jgi:hypothetical protein